MPDYFLSDTIENDGWEAQHCAPFENVKLDAIPSTNSQDEEGPKSKVGTQDGEDSQGKENLQFVTYTSGKTASYVNSEFQRRLALNSDYIQSLKGTRRGIEAILGMFGYSYDTTEGNGGVGTFTIEEQVRLVKNYLDYDEGCRLRAYYENVYEVPDIPHYMDGFPVALVKYEDKDGEKEYLIPWMGKNTKDFYFQSKGGWGKVSGKQINLQSLTTATTIESNGVIPIYGETQPYMKFANTIDDMLMISNKELYENMICYVADIFNIEREYTKADGEDIKEYSHYFSLKNTSLSTRCGFVSNEIYNCYGWKNVSPEEIMNCNTEDGKRVVYLQSLRAEYKGNNPHVGFGHYDDGESYIEKYANLFKEPFENGSFEHIKGSDDYNIVANGKYGFDLLTIIKDNNKCAFFLDYGNNSEYELKPYGAEDKIDNWNSSSASSLNFPDNEGVTIQNNLADESQANGIMNVKTLIINFNIGGNEHFKKYIQDVVLKYLEEMLPSTAILEYRFDKEKAFESEELPYRSGSFDFIRTAHAAVTKGDDSVTIWREYPKPISEM
jgi:hypothetical protein